MKQYADIFAFDRNGQLVLIAEAKSKRGTSSDWAAKMRRNMLAHDLMPNAPYFLLALPDAFYLWDGSGRSAQFSEPTRRIDPHKFLKPLYEKTGISPTNLTERTFEFIVTSWLNQVLRADSSRDLRNGEQDWLVESGLFDRLLGGHLELETAA
jgi:hypothetical protein